MTPLFFGTRRRRLFGVYTPGRAGARARAAVICPPFGQEYLRAHRALRQLAAGLAGAGYHVLRFDYHGTGDSGGDLPEASLAGWREDVATAIDEVCDTSGASRVTLVGFRLGAALAAEAAAERKRQVEALVLWDPVIRGEAYVNELLDDTIPRADAHERPVARAGGGHEVVGFVLTEAMAAEMRAIDLAPLRATLPARTLAVASDDAAYARLQAWGEGLPALQAAHVPNDPPWGVDRDMPGVVPVRVLQHIMEWAA
ncbi:MAG: alpha/beta fold hydrolase [Pseudomonadota bacterium]